jgi:hypothetical protein
MLQAARLAADNSDSSTVVAAAMKASLKAAPVFQ